MAAREQEPDTTSGIEPRFLKLPDVARYLSVSTTKAYALVRSGELPAIKLGGRGVWRVDRHKLDSYLERLEEETRAWTEAHPLNPRVSGGKLRPTTTTRSLPSKPPSVSLRSL